MTGKSGKKPRKGYVDDCGGIKPAPMVKRKSTTKAKKKK